MDVHYNLSSREIDIVSNEMVALKVFQNWLSFNNNFHAFDQNPNLKIVSFRTINNALIN